MKTLFAVIIIIILLMLQQEKENKQSDEILNRENVSIPFGKPYFTGPNKNNNRGAGNIIGSLPDFKERKEGWFTFTFEGKMRNFKFFTTNTASESILEIFEDSDAVKNGYCAFEIRFCSDGIELTPAGKQGGLIGWDLSGNIFQYGGKQNYKLSTGMGCWYQLFWYNFKRDSGSETMPFKALPVPIGVVLSIIMGTTREINTLTTSGQTGHYAGSKADIPNAKNTRIKAIMSEDMLSLIHLGIRPYPK